MNILYTNFHNGPNINGHTTYVSTLAKYLRTTHSIHVATPVGSALYRTAKEINGVVVYGMTFQSKLHRLYGCARKLRKIIIKEKIQIIHVNGSSDHKIAVIATQLMEEKPKIILTKHNDMPVKRFGALLRSRLGTSAIISVCLHTENILKKSPYKNIAISTIFNGVDTDYYSPPSNEDRSEMRLRFFGEEHALKIIVGSNAGTSDYKNWMDMVKAVSRLDPRRRNLFHIAIAGGPIREEDLQEIEKLNMLDSFTYVGMLEDVCGFIGSIDIGFVLSSRVETISFACREMMSCGKPVIVTNYSGLPENISDRNDGWIVPVNSPQEILDLLVRVADEKFDLLRMGVEARAKAERAFGIERFVLETEKVYADLAVS